MAQAIRVIITAPVTNEIIFKSLVAENFDEYRATQRVLMGMIGAVISAGEFDAEADTLFATAIYQSRMNGKATFQLAGGDDGKMFTIYLVSGEWVVLDH